MYHNRHGQMFSLLLQCKTWSVSPLICFQAQWLQKNNQRDVLSSFMKRVIEIMWQSATSSCVESENNRLVLSHASSLSTFKSLNCSLMALACFTRYLANVSFNVYTFLTRSHSYTLFVHCHISFAPYHHQSAMIQNALMATFYPAIIPC